MRQPLVAVGVIVAALGCGKGSQECQVEVADFVDYLNTMKDEPDVLATGAKLPLRANAKEAMKTVLVVEVLPTGARLDGIPVDATSLPNKLMDRIQQLATASSAFRADQVWFAIDEATPWNTVADLVDATAEKGFGKIGFVFAVANKVKPPPHTSVDDELARAVGQERPAALAKVLREVTAPCKQMQDVFQNLATYQTGNKVEIFASGIGKALLDCKCNVNIPKLRSAAYYIFGATPMRGVTINVYRDAPTPLALPAATPWREASKQVNAGMATWFTIQ